LTFRFGNLQEKITIYKQHYKMNQYHINLITMMEGNEEGDKTIEYFGKLIIENECFTKLLEKLKKENEELKKRDEEARKLFEESNEKMMERIKTEEDKVKEINKELDIYKEADTQMTSQIEEHENDYALLKEQYEDLENEKEELETINEDHEQEINDWVESCKSSKCVGWTVESPQDMEKYIDDLWKESTEYEKERKMLKEEIEKLKEQIKNYKINEEQKELLINDLKTKLNNEKDKNKEGFVVTYESGELFEMVNSHGFDTDLYCEDEEDFDIYEFLKKVKSKMYEKGRVNANREEMELKIKELESKIQKHKKVIMELLE
jgi:hypothetical protein